MTRSRGARRRPARAADRRASTGSEADERPEQRDHGHDHDEADDVERMPWRIIAAIGTWPEL